MHYTWFKLEVICVSVVYGKTCKLLNWCWCYCCSPQAREPLALPSHSCNQITVLHLHSFRLPCRPAGVHHHCEIRCSRLLILFAYWKRESVCISLWINSVWLYKLFYMLLTVLWLCPELHYFLHAVHGERLWVISMTYFITACIDNMLQPWNCTQNVLRKRERII